MYPFLQSLGISSLNEMQETSLKAHQKANHIILLSPTGSGKTLAFLLPLLENLQPNNTDTQAIILTPSRELALQIEQVFRSLKSGFKVVCCYGGHDINIENRSLAYTPTLIIGTLGRIVDHITKGSIKTTSISTIILDEFDKSLEFGFQEDMELYSLIYPIYIKRVLTSATSSIKIPDFIWPPKDPLVLDFLENAQSV